MPAPGGRPSFGAKSQRLEDNVKRLASIALAVGFIAIGIAVTSRDAVGSVRPALADTGCNNQSLHGSYSYQIVATTVNGGSPTPNVVAYYVEGGLITFNGSGGLTAISEGSFNGTLFGRENRTGSYSVLPNCTGSFVVSTAPQPCCPSFDIHYDFVMVRNGNELTIFQRDFGAVAAGNAIRQYVSN